jgi:hypothetical protein
MNSSPSAGSRDPVCEAIETFLRDIAAKESTILQRDDAQDSVTVRFGNLGASGGTYEIALVRLAKLMMDEPAYCRLLMNALRGPMKAALGRRAIWDHRVG